MSTKTTFKRIALVAVAALGLGLLSVAPSSAVQQSDTLAFASATDSTDLGTAKTVTLTQSFLGNNGDTSTVTLSIVSAPTGNSTVATLAPQLTNGVNGTPGGSAQLGSLMDTTTNGTFGTVTGKWTVTLPATAIAGTYVIKATANFLKVSDGTIITTSPLPVAPAVTWTVTVASGTVADATSTLTLRAGTASTGSAATVSVAAGSSATAVATIEVTPLTASVASTGSTLISATVSGPGTLSTTSTGTAGSTTGLKSATYLGATNAAGFVHLFGDGTAGTATVTISIGAVVIGTKTVNFTGAASAVTATLIKPAIAAGSAGVAGVISATVKDAVGNGVSGVTLYVVTSGSAIANSSVTSGSAGVVLIPLVGKEAGTSTVTVQSYAAGSAAGTTGFSAAALSVRVGSDVASSVTMSFDKATYSQGEAAVLTVTIKDAAGNAVTDGTYAAFAAQVTATRTMGGEALPLASIATGSSTGIVTYKVNVPSTSGAFSVSALPGAGLLGAGSAVAISASATVSQSAAEIANADAIAAAADAAAEATDAANAATDAANAAAEAADAATAAAQDAADAVATLGTQVAELVAGLKAQIAAQKAAITALTNLVIKIQKKLKA